NINGKVGAYFGSVFWIEKCTLYPIDNFSIALQIKIDSLGGPVNLTSAHIITLPTGNVISEKEVLKKINKR
ncbi:MAG: hypothetical protein K2X39_01575, partial [Silvanigrellaceae bacterium]|nr:hypothetical protein [Silvanigrellaceae bacterium]